MFAVAEQVQIEVRELRRETVGVVRDVFMIRGIAPHQVVMVRHRAGRAAPFEQIGIGNALQMQIAFGNRDVVHLWQEHAHQFTTVFVMFAEQAEGVVVTGLSNPIQVRALNCYCALQSLVDSNLSHDTRAKCLSAPISIRLIV